MKACTVTILNQIERAEYILEFSSIIKAYNFVIDRVKLLRNVNVIISDVRSIKYHLRKNSSERLLIATCSECKYYMHDAKVEIPPQPFTIFKNKLSNFELLLIFYFSLGKNGQDEFQHFLDDQSFFKTKVPDGIFVDQEYIQYLKSIFVRRLKKI